ncbi:MAG: shikimate kinase [Polaribacter sp.]|jgi:shikimate kinase
MQIVLLGYMASGKSSIGKRIAKSLNISFIDLDDFIIDKENQSIADIFSTKGEIYFRKIEHLYLKEILENKKNVILSLGGGTPCYANNMELIKNSKAISIYLQGNVPTLAARLIKKKANRPLVASLSDEQIPEFVAKHLFERRAFYELAEMTFKIDQKKKKEVAKEIQAILLLQ